MVRMKAITVLLVDGRKLLRNGLRVQLQGQHDIRVIGEAEDLPSAAKLVTALAPSVVVVAANGVGPIWAQRVRTISAEARVLALPLSDDAEFVRQALKAGVAGCLTREASLEELIEAIHAVSIGLIYLSPSLASVVAFQAVMGAKDRKLSARECEVLRHIADGDNTKLIASMLGVTSKTVETYRRRIMEKLDRHTVADLVKYAVREGLSTLEETRVSTER